MRKQLSKIMHILSILLTPIRFATSLVNSRWLVIGVIGVQTIFTLSCSGDDDGGGGGGGSDGWNDIGSCDGGTVTIGTQTWHKCNLDVVPNTGNSKCYDNKPENCVKYGRLYNWEAAKTACPTGWHLPSNAEWTKLTDYVGSPAGTKLKAKNGWSNGNGTDDYGFAALPGGYGGSDGLFYRVGDNGYWWSSTGYNDYDAGLRYMYYNYEDVNWGNYSKITLFSVRCLRD